MSSCLRGGGRAYSFEIDVIKPNPSSSLSSSLSGLSSPSSTLSEASNSPPRTISIKKTRAPRKRPNQTYNEAAALLSAIFPNIFPAESPKRHSTKASPFSSFAESPELLPPFPVLVDSPFLIQDSSPDKLSFSIELKPASPVSKSCTSPTSNEQREPGSPSPLDDDFDTESILDEEVGESIDSIMGSLSKTTNEEITNTYTSHINPYLRGLIGLQLGSKLELGLGLRFARNLHQTALRQRDEGDWWRYPAVPVHEIVPKLKPLTTTASQTAKKKKKKVESKEEVTVRDLQRNGAATAVTANTAATAASLKDKLKATGLGLKLNHDDVMEGWSGRGSMFLEDPDSPNSSVEALAKLVDIDLSEDCSGVGGMREASVLRYKEKRRTRLYAKKIRYQVRKVNADRRPRTKGRFVRSPSLLQQAIDEEG